MHVLLFSRELFVRRQKRVVREQALANVPDIGYLVIRSWVHCQLRPTAVDAVHWAHRMPLLAEETLSAMHQALASSMALEILHQNLPVSFSTSPQLAKAICLLTDLAPLCRSP